MSSWRLAALAAIALVPACHDDDDDAPPPPPAPRPTSPPSLTAPAASADFGVVAGNGESTSTWSASARASAYDLYRSTSAGVTTSTGIGFLDQMQDKLLADNPSTKIRLLGINGVGCEAGNDTITAGRDLPWLQDADPPVASGLWWRRTATWSSWTRPTTRSRGTT
jgi:hypothetical protein